MRSYELHKKPGGLRVRPAWLPGEGGKGSLPVAGAFENSKEECTGSHLP